MRSLIITPPSSQPAPARQRARSDAEKAQRRATILQAADAHLSEVGFEAFSMTVVGKQAGVAKGTLYLYFETREEILLALFFDKLEEWAALLETKVSDGTDDSRFVQALYEASTHNNTFLLLMSRLEGVIEHNISVERLITSKRAMAVQLDTVAARMSERLNLTKGQMFDVLTSLASLLLGATRGDRGPKYNPETLPADVQEFMASFDSQRLFEINARRILAGIRQGI